MNKKLLIITTIALSIVLATTGTALAFNANASNTLQGLTDLTSDEISAGRNAGQRFGDMAGEYGVEEEFHAAMLTIKLEAIEAKVKDGSMTQDEADVIIEHLTSCDGDCETAGEFRPEDGWGIFGNGSEDGTGYMGGKSGQGRRGLNLEDCDEENPLNYGSQGRGRGVKN